MVSIPEVINSGTIIEENLARTIEQNINTNPTQIEQYEPSNTLISEVNRKPLDTFTFSSQLNDNRTQATVVKETYEDTKSEKSSASYPQSSLSRKDKLDVEAQFNIRQHFVKGILKDLEKIQPHCGEMSAVTYINNLFHKMLDMRDTIPFDLYVDIVMTFYNALAYKNKWIDYKAEQYKGVSQLLENLLPKKHINRGDLIKAFRKLEELGFNTFPFTSTFENPE